ncbi:MAG: aldehyde dehydrogenase (NADP(+)) [Saprospiraceae bacterium]|nr:aldehyde dehydrogenase (NADP(+)) [Saprospiraceae bacterium]
MELTGQQLIGNTFSKAGSQSFTGFNPATGEPLLPTFYEATAEEIDQAVALADQAFLLYRKVKGNEKAAFLEAIAEEILALDNVLIQTASLETALPEARITGERGRTVGQLRLFASMLRDGKWENEIIDAAQPDRQPLPKPALRQVQIPIGPVAVFGASNFPLAFSVAGGDTVSALAAGCPVVFKAHPAHPSTCELVGRAILKAAEKTGMPNGVFSMVHGISHEVGGRLVQHPMIKAVGFTGSYRGGKALYDQAVRRAEPIPVYAEMGSTNPVFFLPRILQQKGEALAQAFAGSVTLGTGQFCTNPGLFVTLKSDEVFVNQTAEQLNKIQVGAMLTSGIRQAFLNGISHLKTQEGISTLTAAEVEDVAPTLLVTTATQAIANPSVTEEVFGPSTVGILADEKEAVLAFAKSLQGHLTATIHGTEEDLEEYKELIDILTLKVGRLVFNSFPTGVEVSPAMVHGGPFPATTDARSTSVGTTAIYRFTRPICFQDMPASLQNEKW